ncbi:glycosyltransferase family 2 protein [Shimia litoralis]|uniref:glycosyltransferase family 2 protein n=1 Tax=Shimia litoralis TaxID=420403 RepID=UPI001485381D|nr:glycosyltransferase family 2 protein [Shimia litoralis]
MRILSVTSVRNEGPYLLEWIAHHKAAGVTDFLVYSNDCDDGTDLMLSHLHDAGVLTHVPQAREGNRSIQWQALNRGWKHPLRKQADWILVSDVDEYLNIHVPGYRISDLLAALPENTDGIAVPWRLFGHNNVLDIQDAPVTTQFTRAIPPDTSFPISASMFKMLFRRAGPFNQLGVHRPKQKAADKAGLPNFVDGAGVPLPPFLAETPNRLSLYMLSQGRSLVEMNHYAIRSAAAFLVKKARGLPNRSHKAVDLSYWVERNFNTVEDTSIANMRPATEVQLERLLAIDGVSETHAAALAWHQAKFKDLVTQPDHQRLLTEILTAGSSAVLPPALQRQLVRWYQQAHQS